MTDPLREAPNPYVQDGVWDDQDGNATAWADGFAAAVPPGHVVVPAEPTEEMVQAAEAARTAKRMRVTMPRPAALTDMRFALRAALGAVTDDGNLTSTI